MRIAIILLSACLLAGCATSGKKVSDAQLSQIVSGKTTQSELISLLGPPTTEAYSSDGGRVLGWGYAHVGFAGIGTEVQGIAAVIGPDGLVKSWSRSGNTAVSGAASYAPTTAPSNAQPPTAIRKPSPTPICYSQPQCDAMWAEAMVQLQSLSRMRLQTATDSFAQTYNPTGPARMAATVRRIPSPDESTAISADFSCRYECRDLESSALELFNMSVTHAGAAFSQSIPKSSAAGGNQASSPLSAQSKAQWQQQQLEKLNAETGLSYDEYQRRYRQIMGQ